MSAKVQIRLAMRRLWAEDCASQMVEFAVSLPLLVVFVVGIFDFSGAYTLKQKLANAARDGARAAAADPATDLGNGGGVPASVSDAFQVVDNYLIAEKINDCGVNPGGATQSPPLTWKYTATVAGPPACTFTLTINRGYHFTNGSSTTSDCKSPAAAPGTQIVATCVLINYKYNWRFNSVITLLVPGASYAGATTLTTSSVALSEN